MLRKTLVRAFAVGVKTIARGENDRTSLPDAAKTAGDLQPPSRVRGSVGSKSVRGDIKGRKFLIILKNAGNNKIFKLSIKIKTLSSQYLCVVTYLNNSQSQN